MTDREGYFCDLVDAANDYCLLIENVEIYQTEQFLRDLARIFPTLQTSMTNLHDKNLEYSFFSLTDLEARFELYCRLKDYLGESDGYLLESDDTDEMTGSLASDFTDIYFELKRGLNLYQSGEENHSDALTMWQTGYTLAWGSQLMNAQTHLLSSGVVKHA